MTECEEFYVDYESGLREYKLSNIDSRNLEKSDPIEVKKWEKGESLGEYEEKFNFFRSI